MRFMERILVVSSTEKTHAMLAQFLSSCGVQSQLCRAMAGSEARRALVDGEFALVLINTPRTNSATSWRSSPRMTRWPALSCS